MYNFIIHPQTKNKYSNSLNIILSSSLNDSYFDSVRHFTHFTHELNWFKCKKLH